MKKFFQILVVAIFVTGTLSADLLSVGPGEIYTEIQPAIDAALPGDIIEVAPGTYVENLLINKSPLTLRGAKNGQDARGRVIGFPDPLVESIIAPAAGPALEMATAADALVISGFSFIGNVADGSGLVLSNGVATTGLIFSENHLALEAGATGPALALLSNGTNATVSQNVFMGAETSLKVVVLQSSAQFHGLHFKENNVLRNGAALHRGFETDGNRNLGASGLRTPLISDNRFEGHEIGLYGGARSLDQCEISGNKFDNNEGGFAAGPRNSLLTNNEFKNNQRYGLLLTGFGEILDADFGSQGTTVENCFFQGNGTVIDPTGYGDLVLADQPAATQGSNEIRENRFLSTIALFNSEVGVTIAAPYNYWGAIDGPGGLAPGSGGQISGSPVTYEPFYTNGLLTDLNFGTTPLTTPLILEEGDAITGNSLTVASTGELTVMTGGLVETQELDLDSGAKVLIRNGSVKTGNLKMENGAILDVIDGSLSLDPRGIGEFHTVDGSFTFFNSLGSLNINGDTIFSGSSLCLVSDIHFSSGVTATVLGSLIMDGCDLDGTGNYEILVNLGAEFKMTRCEVSQAYINLVGSDVMLRDNNFSSGVITVTGAVDGADIYHNIFEMGAGTLNVLPGASINDTSEGWGNVGSASLVQNQLALNFKTPADPIRTLTAEGDLFVQPGDAVGLSFEISKLNSTTQAVESVMGFNSDYLSHDTLALSVEWSNDLYESTDSSEVIGRFNTAIGLSFDPLTPDGITSDSLVADLGLTARTMEGQTRFFFRTKSAADHALIETRLAVSNSGVPSFRNTPFTKNSGVLTIDGTIPEFGPAASVTQIQSGSPADLLATMVYVKDGTVTVVFDSRDPLAGIDDVDVAVNFSGPGGSFVGTLSTTAEVDISGVAYTRYTFEAIVGPTTANGIYNVDASVMDRSGNLAFLPIGAIEIARFSAAVVVAPEGLIPGSLIRDVVFTATDTSGTALATWNEPITFSSGQGTITLVEIPAGAVALSAKTAWNLRVRLPLAFDISGQANVSFTGLNELPGGDLNGDNLIFLPDYEILRGTTFPRIASVPDITGDGIVNLPDYEIFRSNWLTIGDPL